MNAIVPDPITIASLGAVPCWVAWQTESRKKGKPTKVPYSPTGSKAKADSPETWGTRDQAEIMAQKLPKPFGAGGIGIELSMLDSKRNHGGIDLDTCRDPATGEIAPWARKVIADFNTYTEVSPSGTGVKCFFLFATADLPSLRVAMGGAEYGKQFKRAGDDHPPSIELYLGNRYFAVTEQALQGTPAELRQVETSLILDLVKVTGPAFAGGGTTNGGSSTPKGGTSTDRSRSAIAFRKGGALRRAGKTFDEMCAALRTDPETAAWYAEKAKANDLREVRRIWEKADPERDASEQILADFNAKYMVVNEGGKVLVFAPSFDPVLKRSHYDRIGFDDLRRLYMNRLIEIGIDDKGAPILRNAASVWLAHTERRQFINGVVFDPSGSDSDDGVLNLWQGFGVEPRHGNWSLLRQHIGKVLCAGDRALFNYVMAWMARLVQHPAEQGEVAIVMKGAEGTGKGTLARALLRIFGQHGLAISNAKHLTGNFNGHLRDVVLLFADEAFYAGDRQHTGVLKSIITEPYLTVEAKFANAVQQPNFLHVMMASNDEWVVPASLEARRFCVLEAGSEMMGNHEYFGAIWKQMDSGGYEAMLYDLLALDLTTFNVRNVPQTAGLENQRKLSLPIPEAWWRDCLERGYVFKSKLGLEDVFGDWHDVVSTELLFASYSEFADRQRERHPLTRESLGKFIRKMGAKPNRPKAGITGEHLTDEADQGGSFRRIAKPVKRAQPPSYALGTLELVRAGFLAATGLKVEWEPGPKIATNVGP